MRRTMQQNLELLEMAWIGFWAGFLVARETYSHWYMPVILVGVLLLRALRRWTPRHSLARDVGLRFRRLANWTRNRGTPRS